MTLVSKCLKACARLVVSEYALYRMYESLECEFVLAPEDLLAPTPVMFAPLRDAKVLLDSPDESLRDLARYAGEESHGFGAWTEGILTAACFYWTGQRYATRGFWPLEENEAKLVHIETSTPHRKQGIASQLLRYSAGEMHARGFVRLLARIWYSNRASIAAFEKAGWGRFASVLEVTPVGASKPIRLVHRAKRGTPRQIARRQADQLVNSKSAEPLSHGK